MSSVALIINPDKKQNKLLMQFLSIRLEQECVEMDTEVQALEWLRQNSRRVDTVFLCAEITRTNRSFIDELRAFDHARFATLILLVSQDDSDTITNLQVASDVIDNLLIKPFRIQELVQKVQKGLRLSRSKTPSVLIVEKEPEEREMLRDSMGMIGFANIYEVSDGLDAFNLLVEKTQEISVVVSGWDLEGISGVQLLKKIRQNPKLSLLPFVMVASQTSIETTKNLHAAEVGIQSYLLTPFDPKNFSQAMDTVLQKIEKQNQVGKYLRETKVFEARGVTNHAIDLLNHAVKNLPDTSAIYEALGDVHRLASQTSGDKTGLTLSAEAYEKALKLEPSRTRLVTKLVEVYTAMERQKDTIRILKNYLFRFGFDDELRTKLGKIYLQSGDYGAASVELRRALSVNPLNMEAQSLVQIAKDLELGGTKVA